MYRRLTIEDIVRVPPTRFEESLDDVVEDIIKTEYEGRFDRDLGVILAITEVDEIGEGRLIPGDGASYHNTVFKTVTFKPELHEVLDSEVVEIVEFGAFMRLGPLDGLAHVSQITDDFIVYDGKRGALVGKESNRALEAGNKVRARIVAVSMGSDISKETKINLTMRQPGLGKFEWIEEDRKKEAPAEKTEKEKPKKEAPPKKETPKKAEKKVEKEKPKKVEEKKETKEDEGKGV